MPNASRAEGMAGWGEWQDGLGTHVAVGTIFPELRVSGSSPACEMLYLQLISVTCDRSGEYQGPTPQPDKQPGNFRASVVPPPPSYHSSNSQLSSCSPPSSVCLSMAAVAKVTNMAPATEAVAAPPPAT
jgi:hypothetical protein